MERYDVGFFVSGYIEADSDEEAQERAEDITSQIIAHTDLFYAIVDIDFVSKIEYKDGLIKN